MTRRPPSSTRVAPPPAQRLGQKRHRVGPDIERGRVKLHELEIGQTRPGASRHRQTVAGVFAWVGRVPVDVTDAARREHHGPRQMQHDRVPGVARQRADDMALLHDQLAGARPFEDLNRRRRLDRRAQRAHDLGAGRVAVGVEDPRDPVRRLTSQRQVAHVVPVETGAKREERRDPGRPLLGENPDTLGHRQAGGRRQRILRMRRGRVAGADRCRDTALRHRARTATAKLGFGDQADPETRCLERDRQPADAAPDDQHVMGLDGLDPTRGGAPLIPRLRARPRASARPPDARGRQPPVRP